jgi:hypothetical protein
MRAHARPRGAYEFRESSQWPATFAVFTRRIQVKDPKPNLGFAIRGTSVIGPSEQSGFPSETGHHGPEPGPHDGRLKPPQWLSDKRIAEARRVWSKAYGRVVSVDEAIEILRNVRRLAEVFVRAEGDQR